MICLGADFYFLFFGFYPAWCFLSFLHLCLVSIINFGKFLVLLLQIFLLFLSSGIFYTFGNWPTVLIDLVFSLHFSFGNFYWHLIRFTDSFLSHAPLLISLSKAPFTSVSVISSISFLFLVDTSLLILPTCSYMLSTLFIKSLNILIIVLNSWSENSNISAISESGSDA